MRLTHRLAAAAIREHLWQPWPPPPLGGRPWTMGRELQIFDQLARHVDPIELIGAIEHVRAVTCTQGPIRMTWFVQAQRGRALLSRAIASHHATEAFQAPPGPPRGGGFVRLAVELPPPNTEGQP